MYNDFIHLQRPIGALLYEFKKEIPHLQLEDNEWLLLERYHRIFQIFKKPLDRLQGILNLFIIKL
jgi:hypothetical protein